MTTIRNSPSGKAIFVAPLLNSPAHYDWHIDPATGDDNAAGTVAAPLQTLSEFSKRMYGALIDAPVLATLHSDTIADDRLILTVYQKGNNTVQLNGIVTEVASFTIVTVTKVPPVNTICWDFETSGIDWTTQTARRIQLPTGEIGWVLYAIDANNVRVGPFASLSNLNNTVTPVPGTAALQSIPSTSPPEINAGPAAVGRHAIVNAEPSVILRHLAMDADINVNFRSAGSVVWFGCSLSSAGGYLDAGNLQWNSCMIECNPFTPGSLGFFNIEGSGRLQVTGGLVTTTNTSGGQCGISTSFMNVVVRNTAWLRTVMSLNRGSLWSSTNQYVEGQYIGAAISMGGGSTFLDAVNSRLEGTLNGATFAIDLVNGDGSRFLYTNLPAITGAATNDTRIDNTQFAYAALPQTLNGASIQSQ